MSTLKTQYESFLKENPNLNLTFEEWERNYLIPKLGKIIPIPENANEDENIICAAIWYKDLPTQRLLPKNIDKGIVVCGHRHGHCIDIMRSLGTLRTVQFGPDSVGEHEQGFLTNQNRFVDRIEAAEIAIKQGQVWRNFLINPKIGLFSEDLY